MQLTADTSQLPFDTRRARLRRHHLKGRPRTQVPDRIIGAHSDARQDNEQPIATQRRLHCLKGKTTGRTGCRPIIHYCAGLAGISCSVTRP